MSPRGLARLLIGYAIALLLACVSLRSAMYLDPHAAPTATRIVSLWQRGQRIAQQVVQGDPRGVLPASCSDCTRIVERLIDEGPLPSFSPWLLAASLVPGRDGYAIELDGKKHYVTQTDLLARQASAGGSNEGGAARIRLGLDHPKDELAYVAAQLGTTRDELLERARFRRVLTRREDDNPPWPAHLHAQDITAAKLRGAVDAAADYLARVQNPDGTFEYELVPTVGRGLPGYSWPRHGGAALLLAETAEWTGNPRARAASLRAAKLVSRSQTLRCGDNFCIGEGSQVDVGSSALALLSYVALYEQGAAPELLRPIGALARFLRSQQRPDGELMHVYDRDQHKPIDVQFQYYTGEAAYALSRAQRITHDPADLRAASAALSYLVRSWSFLGSRYFFGTEHWTCQALYDLWERAPDREGLRFCLDYHAYNARFQLGPECELGDYDGGVAQIPVYPPRLTPTASRTESGVATLATAVLAGSDPERIALVESQLRRALAFMMRFQFLPGPAHVFADRLRPLGGIPGSPTELNIRIDYPQHAAGAMIRYGKLLERRAAHGK